MHLLRRIAGIVLISIVATVSAIQFMPEFNFVKYVIPVLSLSGLALLLLAAESIIKEEDLTLHDKNILMSGFLVVVLGSSLFTAGAFVHQSQTSWSGGEIHWHADYEVLVENSQGELKRADLIDPSNYCKETPHESSYMCSLNDRTGTTEYHEHNDNRIHLEGVFKEREDATLSAYFETFGGKLTSREMIYPTNSGVLRVAESNKTNKTLKIIVRSGIAGERGWKIIDNPADYVISPYKRGANLDDIFIVWDDRSANYVKEQLRVNNGTYRGHGILKQGDGF
ncbi:MAG: hypothetical protein ABEK10_00785 [Candidatus Nanosalina sp.]